MTLASSLTSTVVPELVVCTTKRSGDAAPCWPCSSPLLADPAHRLLRRVLRAAACTPSSAARWRSWPRSRRAPTARSSRSATCSAGSATRWTPSSQRDQLRQGARPLRQQVAQLRARAHEAEQLRGLQRASTRRRAEPVRAGRRRASTRARRAPGTRRVQINKGSSDGVARRPAGRSTAPGSSARSSRSPTATPVVMLLTDQEFGVSAQAARRARAGQRSRPPSARPATCCSTSCRDAKQVRKGDLIVTAGTIVRAAAVAVPARRS